VGPSTCARITEPVSPCTSRTPSCSSLQALGRQREAIDQYRQALQLDPNDPNVHNNLAAALLQTGETEGAIAELRLALRLNPDDRDLQANLRAALAARGSSASP
jgi:Flp pilus assembly protein TadD